MDVLHQAINPRISRSAVYRCLRRNGLNQLPPLSEPEASQPFGQTACGFIHIDLKHLTTLAGKPSSVFVTIDRATRFVYVEIHHKRDAQTAASFLASFARAFPHPIHIVLTDNGSEFTDRFAVDKKNKPENTPSGGDLFDLQCRELGREHQLTRPYRPQTNGMVERFNRRLNEALVKVPKQPTGKKHFKSHADRNAYIEQFVENYNKTRLRCLNGETPLSILAKQTELYT